MPAPVANPPVPPARPGLFAQVKATLFYQLPGEELAGFTREVTFANYPRAGIFAIVVGVVNLVCGVLPDLLAWRLQGEWAQNPAYVWWFTMHVFLVAFPIIFVPLMHRIRPGRPEEVRPVHHRIVLFYCWITVFGMMGISLIHQQISGTITVYLLGLAIFATGFYTTARACLVLLLTSLVVFVIGLPFFQPVRITVFSHAVIAADLIFFFWALSRALYSLKARDYIHLKTIARQSDVLAATNTALARANRLKTELIELAAHDLRDPLNTISLSAQTLRDDLAEGSDTYALAQGIDESALRLSALVENLLVETEHGSGEIVLSKSVADLPRLVADVVNVYRSTAAAKSLALHFAADDTALRAPHALVDEARCRQVIENLVSNALKYSPAGRNIWITVAHTPTEGHRIIVRDEGLGFTKEDRSRLFEKYQRLSARPTGGEASTGLGLSIVKHLVTLHGGRVQAESDGPGRGASFVVTLP